MKKIRAVRVVKGYELRVIGLTLFVTAPILYCPPLEFSPDISSLTFVMGLFCVMLGVAQKKRAEKNGGTDQSIWIICPMLLIGIALVLIMLATT